MSNVEQNSVRVFLIFLDLDGVGGVFTLGFIMVSRGTPARVSSSVATVG